MEAEIVVLNNEQVQVVLEAFISGDLSAERLQQWAVMAESGENISMSKHAADIIFELANPLVIEAVAKDRAKSMLKYLDETD